ncbi:hypothetical protein [Aestuariibius sp. HNIBRBA575]|uniref:hypothetical protein n=1 Tax=Aestuariibius sp. HNIBRBA575 TaxID=3233343 RepID=UPI0034A384E7
MRLFPLIPILLVTACSDGANHLGNPLLWPFHAGTSAAQNAVYQQRRGAVEVYVKSHHAEMIHDIQAGSGPHLSTAMDIAQVPAEDRPARIVQLQGDVGIYTANVGALVVALMVYGR